jgi:hypothetical protein
VDPFYGEARPAFRRFHHLIHGETKAGQIAAHFPGKVIWE